MFLSTTLAWVAVMLSCRTKFLTVFVTSGRERVCSRLSAFRMLPHLGHQNQRSPIPCIVCEQVGHDMKIISLQSDNHVFHKLRDSKQPLFGRPDHMNILPREPGANPRPFLDGISQCQRDLQIEYIIQRCGFFSRIHGRSISFQVGKFNGYRHYRMDRLPVSIGARPAVDNERARNIKRRECQATVNLG